MSGGPLRGLRGARNGYSCPRARARWEPQKQGQKHEKKRLKKTGEELQGSPGQVPFDQRVEGVCSTDPCAGERKVQVSVPHRVPGRGTSSAMEPVFRPPCWVHPHPHMTPLVRDAC